MRILFLNHNLIWRGTFFRCLGFARELVRLGHEAHIWTVSREFNFFGNRSQIDGVHVWQTPRWGRLGRHDGGYAPIDNIARLLAGCAGHWDVVHAFDHRPNVILPGLWLELRQRPLQRKQHTLFVSDWCDWWTAGGITTARRHWQWIDRVEQWIEEGSKRCSDGVTVISSALHQRALDIGIPSERLRLLPSGVAIDKFPLLDQNQCRRQLGLPHDVPILGFVGYALWDMQLLAEAFALIKQEAPSTVLLVIGGGVEAQAQQIFRQRFAVGRDVCLPGVVEFDQIPAYLCACDIQLLPLSDTPANRARLPNKLLDYYASGRPTVASDVGETGMFIREHETGIAATSGAPPLAQAASSLIVNKHLAQTYGQNARRLAETRLAYAVLAEELAQIYEALFQLVKNS